VPLVTICARIMYREAVRAGSLAADTRNAQRAACLDLGTVGRQIFCSGISLLDLLAPVLHAHGARQLRLFQVRLSLGTSRCHENLREAHQLGQVRRDPVNESRSQHVAQDALGELHEGLAAIAVVVVLLGESDVLCVVVHVDPGVADGHGAVATTVEPRSMLPRRSRIAAFGKSALLFLIKQLLLTPNVFFQYAWPLADPKNASP
jgi:hypothetical protein